MKLIVQTDGGSRGNPGRAAYGFVFLNEDGSVIYEDGAYIGITTNNEAEYQGLLAALRQLLQFSGLSQVSEIEFQLDSNLVVQQVLGRWKIKEQRLLSWAQDIRQELKRIPVTYRLRHVPRDQNRLADAKVNEILNSHS